MVEFGLDDYKASEGYLDTVDMVTIWDFSSSRHKVYLVMVFPVP